MIVRRAKFDDSTLAVASMDRTNLVAPMLAELRFWAHMSIAPPSISCQSATTPWIDVQLAWQTQISNLQRQFPTMYTCTFRWGLGWFYCLSCSMIVFLANGNVAYSQGKFIKLFAKQIKWGQQWEEQLHTRESKYPACASKSAHRRETPSHQYSCYKRVLHGMEELVHEHAYATRPKTTLPTYIEGHNTINNECRRWLHHAICMTMEWWNILRVCHTLLGDVHHLAYANCMYPCNPNIHHNPTLLLASNCWACHSMLWLQNQVIHGNPYRPHGDTASYVLHSREHYDIKCKGALTCCKVNPI